MENLAHTKECIICLDNIKLQGTLPVNILHIQDITKTCDCEYIVHSKCLYEWLNKKKVCLICNKEITRSHEQNIIIEPTTLSYNSQIVLQNMPPPPYELYTSTRQDYSSDSNSETSSYYSQDLREQLNTVREQSNIRTCICVIIVVIVVICILFGN